jgi:hypothetical protein
MRWRWPSLWFDGGGRLRTEHVVGNVVVGGNTGIVYQIYDRGEPPEPPRLDWEEALSAAGPFEIFNLLSWKSRLSPALIGREREHKDLLDWALGGRKLRIRLQTGPGGAGKTRLAAEFAQSLGDEGWQAGFIAIDKALPRPLSRKGLLVVIDYPEEWRPQVRALLQSAARMAAPPALVRVLLLSRRPLDEWRDEIDQAGASALCDAYEVPVGPLATEAATKLFRAAMARLAEQKNARCRRSPTRRLRAGSTAIRAYTRCRC